MPIRGSAGNHHEIRNIGQTAHIQQLHFQSLHVVEGVEDTVLREGLLARAVLGGATVFGRLVMLRVERLSLCWHYVVRFLE